MHIYGTVSFQTTQKGCTPKQELGIVTATLPTGET